MGFELLPNFKGRHISSTQTRHSKAYATKHSNREQQGRSQITKESLNSGLPLVVLKHQPIQRAGYDFIQWSLTLCCERHFGLHTHCFC